MIHCYTQCQIVYDDSYRTRFDCVICKKSFYQLKDRVSESANELMTLRKDSSVLLINGSPFITCANEECQQIERQHDSKKIRIFLKWEEIGQEIAYTAEGIRYIRTRWKMVLKSALGCIKCHSYQDSESQKLGKPHIYGLEVRPNQIVKLTPDTTKYSDKQEYVVVTDRFESGDGIRSSWVQDSTPLSQEDLKALYGPFNDRRGK